MITKFHILSLAVAAALAGCASDNVAWRDSAGRDTTGANYSTSPNYNSGSDYNNGIRDNGSTYNTSLPDNPQATLNDKTRSLAPFSARDNGFIRDVEAGDAFEISAGQKALVKSSDDQIKSLAQHLVDDHSKADKQIMALATRHGVSTSFGMSPDQINMLQKLDSLSGADFDREYLSQQEQAHKDTIAKFQDAQSNADAQDVRDWARATFPTLQNHLSMVEARLGNNGNLNHTNSNGTDMRNDTGIRNDTNMRNDTDTHTNLNNSGAGNMNNQPGYSPTPTPNNNTTNVPNNTPGMNPANTGEVGTPGSSGMNK
jgi:putative membrane protein